MYRFHKHLKRRFIVSHMRSCAEIQVLSLSRLIRHLAGIRHRGDPRVTDRCISMIFIECKWNPVVDHFFIVVCREQLRHPCMGIFFKLRAPLLVPRRHLFILCDLVGDHIFHLLIDRIILFVFRIRHIPKIPVEQGTRKPEALVGRRCVA